MKLHKLKELIANLPDNMDVMGVDHDGQYQLSIDTVLAFKDEALVWIVMDDPSPDDIDCTEGTCPTTPPWEMGFSSKLAQPA